MVANIRKGWDSTPILCNNFFSIRLNRPKWTLQGKSADSPYGSAMHLDSEKKAVYKVIKISLHNKASASLLKKPTCVSARDTGES